MSSSRSSHCAMPTCSNRSIPGSWTPTLENLTSCRASCSLLRHGESRPGMRVHVPLQIFLPGELRVRAYMLSRLEVHATGMTGGGTKTHFCRQARVGSLVLDSPSHSERWLPRLIASRRKVDVPVQGAFVRIFFVLVRVVMVGQKALCRRQVDLALILRH